MYGHLLTFGSAFLGAAVESVEALTIVLAVGVTRGWRAPLQGAAAAVIVLAVLILVAGGVIVRIPESTLRLVIGTLILLFGLRWLQKAVLRSAGVIPKHDEAAAFAQTVAQVSASPRRDLAGFIVAFKGVLLEGLEVAFIVIAVGANNADLGVAAAGGIVAVLVVSAAGIALRYPLARVPENALKFAVGVALSSLGTFWAAEGMGVTWPVDVVSILALAGLYLGGAWVSVTAIRVNLSRPRVAG
ncbi:MAG: COG4280 domain-containing protein [Candidatus Dormibacteria bacterium]